MKPPWRMKASSVVLCVVCLLITTGCTESPAVGLPRGRPKELEPGRTLRGESEPAAEPVKRRGVPELRGVSFIDVAQERGLNFEWPRQRRPMRALDAFGCGCATFDADNDGWQDVLLMAEPGPALFHNLEGRQFVDITSESGLSAAAGEWKGCSIGDFNADGYLDVLLTGYHCLALFENKGGLRFAPVTEAAGLDPSNNGHWGSSSGFMDLDGDGWLDLVILNFVSFGPDSQQYCLHRGQVRAGCIPRMYPPERNEIWRNTGRGSFELVPES